mgnify:CR=1 FL=1
MNLPCRRFGRTNLEMPVLSLGGMRFQKSWDEMKFSEISLNDQNKVENILNLADEFGFNDIQRDVKLGGEISLVFWLIGGVFTLFFSISLFFDECIKVISTCNFYFGISC